MQAVILAAGEGSRMRPLTETVPKSLLPVAGQTLLGRLLHQLNEYGDLQHVVVVTGYRAGEVEATLGGYEVPVHAVRNRQYASDTNILSMEIALEWSCADTPTIMIEADVFMDDLAISRVVGAARRDTSTWFCRGPFVEGMSGGILRADDADRVLDIRLVDDYDVAYASYRKLLGVMTVAGGHLAAYREALAAARRSTTRQYYLTPWIENLARFETLACDLDGRLCDSVNTEDEYYDLLLRVERGAHGRETSVQLVPVDELHPIEEVRAQRVEELRAAIEQEEEWNRAIVVERTHRLVLDGHHRLQVARSKNLRYIPAVLVDYDEVPVWSLRQDERVSRDEVVRRSLSGRLYPNKTAKHQFPALDLTCSFDLERLAS